MKKIEDFVFTVTKILSSARKFEQMQFFFINCSKLTRGTRTAYFFVEQLTFFCPADDFFKKSVEQSRFEQMHFEQLTLTRFHCTIYTIKVLVQPKMSLNREFLIWKERGRVCEIRGGKG